MSLVVEEKPIYRSALGQILVECRGQGQPRFASSIEEALDEISATRPSVTLIDLFTVNYDFQKLRELIIHARPGLVLVVDDRANPAFASLARWAGAAGYLTKDVDAEAFKRAIMGALDGQADLSTGASEPGLDSPPTRGLSARQLEVLGQLTLGKSNREIGEALGISTGTVKAHVHAILTVIGARNRTHAALIAGRFHARTNTASARLPARPSLDAPTAAARRTLQG